MNDKLFEELKSQLLSFVAKQQELENKVLSLQKENEALKADVNEKRRELGSFQNQQKISKIVLSEVGEGEGKADLKRLLNNYIKEIDRCITHLKA